MSVLSVNGCKLHWVEGGRGPPIVLLHGLCDSHRTWFDVAPTLAKTRRVLMLDLPGHGLSERPDASYSLEWHAQMVASWMEALRLEEVDLVGHSFGGGVALWMQLLAHRPRVRALALVASGGLGREVTLALRLASVPWIVERFGQPFMARATRMVLGVLGAAYEEEEIVRLSEMNATAGTARAFARSVRDVIDWRGQRRHVRDGGAELRNLPPMALFWGALDRVIPIRHAADVQPLLGEVPILRFEDCGHFPHHERPRVFVHALESFLNSARLPGHAPRPSRRGHARRARTVISCV